VGERSEMADEQVRFRVNGKDYPMPTELSLGEMCDAERFFGVEFGNNASSGIRMAAAMLWIAIKRVDPDVTVDDIRELPTDVFEGFGEVDESPPVSDAEETDTSGSSGDDSRNGGDDLASFPEPIGQAS
jgi:hypothetical protein